MEKIILSKQALKRMPYYYNCLKKLEAEAVEYVSASKVAKILELNEVQVRKDLAAVSTLRGMPKKGFETKILVQDIGEYLGYNNSQDALLVGVGHLGKALLSYQGFKAYGIDIIAAFDTNEKLIGSKINGKPIYAVEQLPILCRRLGVKIAILTVPASAAQPIADILSESGIHAIWNFAPVHITVDDSVLVQNENMASSLAVLSNHLKEKIRNEE